MLGVLVLTLVICNIDRNVIAVLLEPIREEFRLRDWQLGLLAGLTFTTLYCVGSLVVSRLADRYDRVTIVSAALFLWSAFTFLCGHAGSFVQLLTARASVGLTESGSQAPSHSLIADRFEGRDRSLAMGIYAAGALMGSLIALPLGGYAAQAFGWRGALMVVSLPGLLLAVVLRLTLRDPRIRGLTRRETDAPSESLPKAARVLLSNPAIRHLILGGTLSTTATAAGLSFGVSVLVRSRGFTPAEAGLISGLFTGAFALIGTVGSGWLVSRLVRRDHRWRARVPMCAQLISIPLAAGFVLLPVTWMAVLCLGVGAVFGSAWMGPTFSALQDSAGPKRRATVAALLLVSYNFLGFGLGPLFAGVISDALRSLVGANSLAYGLLALQPFALWSALHYYLASKALKAEPATE
jgi:predicted MFS family arabinose efflux permease